MRRCRAHATTAGMFSLRRLIADTLPPTRHCRLPVLVPLLEPDHVHRETDAGGLPLPPIVGLTLLAAGVGLAVYMVRVE